MSASRSASTSVPPPSVAPPALVESGTPAVPPVVVGPTHPRVASGPVDVAFQRDKFLLKQKRVSIEEKYMVADEHGREILFVERPRHMLRNIGALIAGVISGLVAGSLLSGF